MECSDSRSRPTWGKRLYEQGESSLPVIVSVPLADYEKVRVQKNRLMVGLADAVRNQYMSAQTIGRRPLGGARNPR